VDHLQDLNQASIIIQSVQTEAEAVNHIFKCLSRIGYSRGMLSLINENTGQIEGKYALGKGWEDIKNDTKRELGGNDILAKAIREKCSQLSKDCTADISCDQPAIRKAGIKSQCVIPLVFNDKAIGTLQIDLSDKQGIVHGPEGILMGRMKVLELFASQIAVSIGNIRNRSTINFLESTLTETAHEFRSPLHNIMTQIGGLKNQLPKKTGKESEISKIFKIISEEAHRANRQMENTLLFSKRSRDLLGYDFEPDRIQDVIQLCVENYNLRAKKRGITIVVKDSVKRLPMFSFDKSKIEQVVLLLKGALRAENMVGLKMNVPTKKMEEII